MKRHLKKRLTPPASRDTHRRGIVLIVVVGLLGLLALIGFTFFSFANQEQGNAEYFADAAKEYQEPGLDPDTLFAWGIEQLIKGAPQHLHHSALWGGYHSLVPNMFGRDLHPFSGRGINVAGTPGGVPFVDQNRDGTPDNPTYLEANHSPGRRYNNVSGGNASAPPLATYPRPDVGYTYPDYTSQFLATNYHGVDPSGRPVHIIKPSFHPAQVLRDLGGPINDTTDTNNATAFNDPTTLRRVFAPHQEAAFVRRSDGVTLGRRYINANEYAANLAFFTSQGITGPFPFAFQDQGVWNMRRWAANTGYKVGDWVFPNTGHNGLYYRCVAVANATPSSGSSAPAWGSYGIGVEFNDGDLRWRVFAQPQYSYHTDADGDGVNEAVYLDLDFPVQETPDGQKFVPQFAFTVYDADGLVNLAAQGNLHGPDWLANLMGRRPGGAFRGTHRSHQGYSPGEINPTWALSADPRGRAAGGDRPDATSPATQFAQHNAFWRLSGASVINDGTNWQEMAQREWVWANSGRMEFSTAPAYNDVFAGRYGEISRLIAGWNSNQQAQFPFPGRSNFDDENNRNLGEGNWIPDPVQNTLRQFGRRPYKYPHDYSGVAKEVTYNADRTRRLVGAGINRWPAFFNFSSETGTIGWRYGTDNLPGTVYDSLTGHNTVFPLVGANGRTRGALTDDATELATDPLFAKPNANLDNNFGPAEMAFLATSPTDQSAAGITSRLATLMPFNMKESLRSNDIRKMFTTASYNVKNFGLSRSQRRAFEHALSGADANFPNNPLGATPINPLRPAVVRLLGLDESNRTGRPNALQQRRLPLGKVVELNAGGNLVIRDPVEHPANLPADQATPLATDVRLRGEVRARLDRQRMARDIYVLLYLYCGGDDSVNPWTTINVPNRNNPDTVVGLYSERQCAEMAQFAINLVNAMDRDQVLDRFEYDVNLQNGWNLNDNAFDDDGVADRRVVTGVETQLLTLSEGLTIFAKRVEPMPGPTDPGVDHLATEYRDDDDRYFTYIELRNASPYNVNFANEAWRIIVKPNKVGFDPMNPPTEGYERTLTPLQGQVAGGGLFTIMTAGDAHNIDPMTTRPRPSYFRVDANYDHPNAPATYPIIAPRQVPAANAKIDLITEDATYFRLRGETGSDITGTKGALLNSSNMNATNIQQPITIELQRRTYLHREAPTHADVTEEADNPWVTVDSIRIQPREFELPTRAFDRDSMPQNIDTKLRQLRSQFWPAPLGRTQQTPSITAAATQANSIGANNAAAAFRHWQWHPDSPVTSVADLLSIPLFAPRFVSSWTFDHGIATAGLQKFLKPLDSQNAANTPGNRDPKRDNRWYRLFAFVDVPGNTSPFNAFRDAGQMNWNTIRHPGVLAALLDDRQAFSNLSPLRNTTTLPKQTIYLPDAASEAGRDWWRQFLLSRDGRDVLTDLTLPGVPRNPSSVSTIPRGSRPFRDFGFVGGRIGSSGAGNPVVDLRETGLEDTFLRSLPLAFELANESVTHNQLPSVPLATDPTDISPYHGPRPSDQDASRGTSRRLWEMRSRTNQRLGSRIDHHTRHRLLSKLLKNSTTRSHVFVVFLKVDYFEAYEDTATGAVRIGKKMDTSPGHRIVFVVDRSRAFQELKPADFSTDAAHFTLRPTFNHNRLILHRQVLQ